MAFKQHQPAFLRDTTTGQLGFTNPLTGVDTPLAAGSLMATISSDGKTPYVGQVLTAVPPTGTIASGYQWYRDSGSGPVAISGATGPTYTRTSADVAVFGGTPIGVAPSVTSTQYMSLASVSYPPSTQPPAFRTQSNMFTGLRSTTGNNPSNSVQYPTTAVKLDPRRTSVIVQNDTPGPVDFGLQARGNNDYNTPGSYATLASGQEVAISGTDATTNQIYVLPTQLSITALTSSGTTATATLANHGFTEGQVVAIYNGVPTTYNGYFPIHVIDANTFSYTLSATAAAVTTLPKAFDAYKTVTIITESST